MAEWDPTAVTRARLIADGDVAAAYEADRGPMYSTESLVGDFEVIAYAAPFVVARRRVDGVLGSLMFTHQPRVYFGWIPDDEVG
jgi:hypothetical protein